jgi:iron complex outermembrane recepter protein
MSNARSFGWLAGLLALLVAPLAAAQSTSANDAAIEEVVVTGSFIKRKNQADMTSPIQTLGSNELGAAAAFVPSDVVATLTTNSGAQNQSDGFNQTFSIGTTNINLRGLGVSSTLTLLNGRRQTLSAATTLNGDQFVDLSSLVPTIAIDRVEILEDGASSLYGSDAVAGVVNFFTRDSFEGVELEGNYATTSSDSQEDLQLSALFGKNFNDKASLIAAVSYFDRGSLSANDRHHEFEQRDAQSIFSQPGTFLVFPAAGPPTRTLDPSCNAQAAISDDISVITAGPIAPTCQFDFGDFFSLVAKEERTLAFARSTLFLTETTEAFIEVGYANNDIVTTGSPSQPILFPPVVPDSNPGAAAIGIPPGGRALWFGRVEGDGEPASQIPIENTTLRLAAGLNGDFDNGWSWEAGITRSENENSYTNTSDTRVDRFLAALNGTGGPNNNQFYNPVFGASNDPAVREDFRGLFAWDAESSLLTIDAHVTGELFDTGAGSVGFAAGIQYRKDELSYDYSQDAEQDNLYFFIGNDDFSNDQDVTAIFVEGDVPVTEDFSVQLALRHERFDDENTTDPKIGFLWRPADEWSLRGTWGTSFRAPSIFQRAGQFRVPARIFDPVSGGFATISQQTAADPADPLESQSSDTFNFGVSWDSVDTGITASIDYWRFEYSNFITPENASALVATDPFGPQVTRDPTTDALLAVTTFYRNAGTLETDGLDVDISKVWETAGAGEFTAQLNITQTMTYDLEDPILGKVDGLGQRNFTNFGVPTPETRANLGLLWNTDRHAGNIFVRHIGSYDDDNSGGAAIDAHSVVDVQYQYAFNAIGSLEEGPVLTLGAKNLFDEMPPDVTSRTGYDALTHNPLGRRWYLSLRQTF